jgi:hypothetical protein
MRLLPIAVLTQQNLEVFSLQLRSPLHSSFLHVSLSQFLHHQEEEGRLGAIQIILPQSIGNKPVFLNDKREGVEDGLSRVEHVASNEAEHDPVAVPVVALSKPSTRHQDLFVVNLLDITGALRLASSNQLRIAQYHFFTQLVPSLMQFLSELPKVAVPNPIQKGRALLIVIEGCRLKNNIGIGVKAQIHKFCCIFGEEVGECGFHWHFKHQINEGLAIDKDIGFGNGLEDGLRAKHRMRALLMREGY